MNRNTVYDYLKSKGMYGIFVWADNRKSYHTEFRLNNGQGDCWIYFDWGYIRHVESIHLCQKEMVIESKYSDMKVNVFYKDIKNFEVKIALDED